MRKQFERLHELNSQLDEKTRLTELELLVDPDYEKLLLKKKSENLEETRKELAWDKEFFRLQRSKLEEYFIKELEVSRFSVKAFKTKNFVTTFKVKKMNEYIKGELEKIFKFISATSRPASGESQAEEKKVKWSKEYGIYTKKEAEDEERKIAKERNKGVRTKTKVAKRDGKGKHSIELQIE